MRKGNAWREAPEFAAGLLACQLGGFTGQVAFSALAKPVASADLILAGMQVCWIVRRYKTDSNTAG